MSDQDPRVTDAPYGAEETRAIIAQVKDGATGKCPRCGGSLELGPPVKSTPSLFTVVMVRCPTCRRAVFAGEYLKKHL
ncbi:MAG TPA: hypothetical protein VGI92_14365 [Gemmatimonadales bacterium]|jgi:endogenous inhibitor of DNA gyrase (YacG/DUF329 family)